MQKIRKNIKAKRRDRITLTRRRNINNLHALIASVHGSDITRKVRNSDCLKKQRLFSVATAGFKRVQEETKISREDFDVMFLLRMR